MKALFFFLFCVCIFPTLGFAAETALTVTTISETAALIPYESVDTTNGNKAFNPNGDLILLILNGGASEGTVTLTAQQTSTSKAGYGTLTKPDNTISFTSGQKKMVGPLPMKAYNDSSGYVILSFSGDASADFDVAAVRVVPQ